jgi:hypothetical protein
MGIMAGGKGGGKNALAAKPNLLNALRVQTSSYGQVIPIVYGQNRISGRLLWSGDFAAIPHTSTQKVGGKGLGSGGGSATLHTPIRARLPRLFASARSKIFTTCGTPRGA